MFRALYDAVRRAGRRAPEADPAREARTPDPYVWRLPSPYDARWRRWWKRSRAAGHYLPFPADEPCWQQPPRPPAPSWRTNDDVVRPYVLRR
ncbi:MULTISPECIES: hypothetical protein [unclassified Streptomyces]|uniref:hypothetical protein n=1 Tax=unclassified Streptomyces TaxID=2593676 RepID=UPI003803A70D